jgi:2'-5' RNA ligase
LEMEKSYYRTFLALPVQVGADVLTLRRGLMRDLEGERISWVDPERFHITLRFLGDTLLNGVSEIISALKERGFHADAQEIPVRGVGSFGPRKNPRVIWIGFGNDAWFQGLKEEVDALLEEQGFSRPDQLFTPHLTLGRIRSLRNLSRYHQIMEGVKGQIFDPVWIKSLVYYRSILGAGGPEYRKLKEITLSGSRSGRHLS